MRVIKIKKLMEYLNGRFILRSKTYYGNEYFDSYRLRHIHEHYGELIVVNKFGDIEKINIYVDELKPQLGFNNLRDFHRQYLMNTFGHCSCMRYLAEFFNIQIEKNYWGDLYLSKIIDNLIKELPNNESLYTYEKTIRNGIIDSYNRFQQLDPNVVTEKPIPDTVDFLVGGRAEVFRNGDVFIVSMKTTAYRYDIHTLADKIFDIRKDIDKKAILALHKNSDFRKLGLKPGLYKADKVTLTKDRRIVYVFDLKDRVRELLKEKDIT